MCICPRKVVQPHQFLSLCTTSAPKGRDFLIILACNHDPAPVLTLSHNRNEKGKECFDILSLFLLLFSRRGGVWHASGGAAQRIRAAGLRGGGCARHASDVRAQWCAGQRAKAWWIVALVRGHNGVQPQLRGSHSWPRRTAELAACRTVTQDGMRRPRASPEHKKRIRGGYLNPPLIRLFGSYEGTLGWATSLLPG